MQTIRWKPCSLPCRAAQGRRYRGHARPLATAGRVWCRPLLQVSSHDVRDWLRQRGHAWIEDPSNTDQRFTRNRIRAQPLPALQAVFPVSGNVWTNRCQRSPGRRVAARDRRARPRCHGLASHDPAPTDADPLKAGQRLALLAADPSPNHPIRRPAGGAAGSDSCVHDPRTPFAPESGRGFVLRQGAMLEWSAA